MLLLWALASAIPLAAVGVAVAIVVGAVLWIRGNRSRRTLLIAAGIPIGCGVAPILLLGALISLPLLYCAIRPASDDYEEALGAPPTAVIRNLRGRTDPGFDSRYIYLGFDRTPAAAAEIDRLLAHAERRGESDMLDSNAYDGGTPGWWFAAHGWQAEHGCKDVIQRNYVDFNGWRDIVVADCPSRGRIFVLAGRID